MTKQQKSMYQEWWFYIVIAVFIAVIWMVLPGNLASGQKSEYDTFAQCLTDEGAVMYGTDWCPHCQRQKELFGTSFNKINFVNCDTNKEACLRALVQGYPTWVIGEQRTSGTQSLATLAQMSGCELTKDA